MEEYSFKKGLPARQTDLKFQKGVYFNSQQKDFEI